MSTIEIRDGWLYGFLRDDRGNEWPIKRFPQESARGPLHVARPNLILHTTETDGYVERLRYPSQWQCGEGIIGQHIRLGYAGDAVNDWDGVAQQIEMVGWSQLGIWLPKEGTLGPTVALTAWLHKTGRIKDGLHRPDDWPIRLDKLPAAVSTYYRRRAGLWPQTPGVYGHVDIPDNSHWDPGSFDYPVFFKRVRDILDGEDEEMRLDEYWAGEEAFRRAWNESGGDPGPPPEGKSEAFNAGWKSQRFAAQRPEPGQHDHEQYASKGHPHTIS